MAEESQDGQDKTEEPSQRKIDKAKEDGQVLQSKEMFVFTSIAMGLIIFLFIPQIAMPGMNEWGKLFQIQLNPHIPHCLHHLHKSKNLVLFSR